MPEITISRRRLLLIGAGILAVLLLTAPAASAWLTMHGGEERRLLTEAEDQLRQHALGPLPDSIDLERGMIEGMLLSLNDPYAAYLARPQTELERQTLSGRYGGIGASLGHSPDGRYMLIPYRDGPAARAGIAIGDVLVRVGDLIIAPSFSEDSVLAELRGPVGSTIRLELETASTPSQSYWRRLIRQEYQLPSVRGYLAPSGTPVGVLEIATFSERTPDELTEQFDLLRDAGMRALVLDLRGNSGGLLDAALHVADFFLSRGIIYFEVLQSTELAASASMGQPGESIPLAVIIDGSTISAAELLAGALQDNQRARLFGQPSFGKGAVQSVIELSDGSRLHVTSATWLTPNRSQIESHGIQPDFVTEPKLDGYDPALSLAVEFLLQQGEP